MGRRSSTTTPRVGVLCSRMNAMRTTCLVSRQVVGRSEGAGGLEERRTKEERATCVHAGVHVRVCVCCARARWRDACVFATTVGEEGRVRRRARRGAAGGGRL